MGDSDRLRVFRQRVWRVSAGLRRAIESPASLRSARALARPRGIALAEWNRKSFERHAQYRSEVEPAAHSVTVMCASNRPHLLDRVAANVVRQAGVRAELVFVANGPGFDPDEVARAFEGLDGVVVEWPSAPMSLGSALNLALERSGERYVAKFDDDDHYGPQFLADSLRAHRLAHAGVVGKHSYYADVVGRDARYLRFPGHEFTYGSTLAGGTLLIDRERTGDLRFADISLGEDGAFIAACHRRGVSTFSADRFNFIQHRGDDNTWGVSVEQFTQGAMPIDPHAPEHQVDR